MQRVCPARLRGAISAPPSKSFTQRAIAAATLSDETTEIHFPSDCDDAQSCLEVARALGAKVESARGVLKIQSRLNPIAKTLDCGESGLCLRLFSAIAALRPDPITLRGRGTLLKRPIAMIEEPLRTLGVQVATNKGLLPVSLQGPLQGGSVEVDGSVSSQFVSGLLMALPCCEQDSIITIRGLKSRDYVSMTLHVLEQFGVSVSASPDLASVSIPGRQIYRRKTFMVEGDWSGAAFFLVAGAIAGTVEVTNLSSTSLQADRAIVKALELAGANVNWLESGALAVNKGDLRAFSFDATDCPDLFPPLTALAAHCSGRSVLRGVKRLHAKESDRAVALQKEFACLGTKIEIKDDEMQIIGGLQRGGQVRSHGDHRIAMACAISALRASASVEIEGPDCVSKSYPNFFNDLAKLRVN